MVYALAKLVKVRRRFSGMLLVLGLMPAFAAGGCGPKSPTGPTSHRDICKNADGPTPATLRRAIAAVPIVVPGSEWVEVTRGHTRKCRLHWVQIIPSIASESTPQQLLFFDRNTPLGSPSPDPKPYITVLSPGDDTVTVQYRWRIGSDRECCPSGIGTVRFRIAPDGRLIALDAIPH